MKTCKKSKKLNCRRRLRKSPVRPARHQAVDEHTGPLVIGGTRAATMTVPGRSCFSICGRPTCGPGSHGGSTKGSGDGPLPRPTPASTVPPSNATRQDPPPNATVVVCVLAGTGRADLWIRNNRGQTPLDLCPADQPLRRALIRCCDVAARARIAKAATMVAGGPSLASAEQQQSQAVANDAAADNSMIAGDAGPPKQCSKRAPNSGNPGAIDELITDRLAGINLIIPSYSNSEPCDSEQATPALVIDDNLSGSTLDADQSDNLNLEFLDNGNITDDDQCSVSNLSFGTVSDNIGNRYDHMMYGLLSGNRISF